MDYAKRSKSVTSVTDSWRAFYRSEGETIGRLVFVLLTVFTTRGGTGKVFLARPIDDSSQSHKIFNYQKVNEVTVPFSGTFGEVFEVINPIVPGKSLAVKLIRRFRGGRDSIEKIRKEIMLMKKLQSSHNDLTGANVPTSACPLLVSVHEDLTEVAIVMEFAKGGSLFDLCCERYSTQNACLFGDVSPRCAISKPPIPPSRRRSPVVGDSHCPHAPCPLPESYIASVIEKISSALMYMHEKAKIVHLDIKVRLVIYPIFLEICSAVAVVCAHKAFPVEQAPSAAAQPAPPPSGDSFCRQEPRPPVCPLLQRDNRTATGK
ncbi:unnamed protein product [Schistocephalus solidus]|uniref:Protein kinase domain-containing protein n=1 Tax=Schistocephalus solidus TaxID=70667 RepID=A0A3P7C489_SCHSO|nr:unnamed protein product [Schistocephalus solidus]